MSRNETVSRVWREAVASYGPSGVSKREAVEAAENTLMVEVRAGRLELDLRRAVRAELTRADEADGRAADHIIERLAFGQVPIDDGDLDLVVTLGGGFRKAWRDVVPADLEQMVEIRHENFRKVASSFKSFQAAASRIRETVFEHGTVGAAFAAGGFPPSDLTSAARGAA
jgi:hypothetical protein